MMEEPVPYTLGQNLQAILRLRRFFLPFMLPALGLLALALVQADIATTAARAGGQVIDALISPDAAAAPAAAAGVGEGAVPESPATRQSLSPAGHLFELVSRDASALHLALLLALVLILAQALSIWVEQLRSIVSLRFRDGMQRTLIDSLSRELFVTRGRRSPGNTSQIFMTDSAGLSGLLIFGLVRALEDLFKLAVYVFAICMIPGGWQVALAMVPLAIVYQASVTGFFLSRTARASDRSEGLMVGLRSRTTEFFDVLGRLMYFKGERREGEKLLKASVEGGEANRRFQLVSSVEGSISGLLAMLALPLVVLMLRDSIAGNPGTAVEAQMLVINVLAAIAALASIPTVMASYSPSLRRVEDILNVPEVEPEPPQLPVLKQESDAPPLTVRGLTFGYPGSPRPVLEDVSFELPAGSRVGVVADNGTGKSTLARLLVGDLRPDEGRVELNGVDVTSWHLHWRREIIGFVPAEPGFLRGSIADNVLFGRTPEEAPNSDRAVEICRLKEFADERFGGLHEPMDGPVVDVLSTGQRKKVSIARLLAGDQRVWILDEPGAGLSPSAMGDVARALEGATKGRTSLIITHDPDVFVTDFNLFFEMGRLVDSGPHHELLERNPDYRKLVERYVQERDEPELTPIGAPDGEGFPPGPPHGFPDSPPRPPGAPPLGDDASG